MPTRAQWRNSRSSKPCKIVEKAPPNCRPAAATPRRRHPAQPPVTAPIKTTRYFEKGNSAERSYMEWLKAARIVEEKWGWRAAGGVDDQKRCDAGA
jgi:hypothetical protein